MRESRVGRTRSPAAPVAACGWEPGSAATLAAGWAGGAPLEAVVDGLVAGAERYLRSDGRLLLYGPFKRGGKHTAISNAVFDSSLRERDPEWGVRDVEALEQLADNAGLGLVEISEMPANNLVLAFERTKAA